MIELGSVVKRFDGTAADARRILASMLTTDRKALKIQTELIDDRLQLIQTNAGRLQQELEQRREHKTDLAELRSIKLPTNTGRLVQQEQQRKYEENLAEQQRLSILREHREEQLHARRLWIERRREFEENLAEHSYTEDYCSNGESRKNSNVSMRSTLEDYFKRRICRNYDPSFLR
jgi:hypothetical protein